MNKERTISQESFDRLLRWLDPDRERAGERYVAIERRLTTIFACRGCRDAEGLASETMHRVALKVSEIADTYEGDPALYFYGVAQKVHLESLREKTVPLDAARTATVAGVEEEEDGVYDCLEGCVARLPEASRELVLEYYAEEKRAKIERRKQLARRLGIALNALRIRAHRIRAALQECVKDCLEGNAGAVK